MSKIRTSRVVKAFGVWVVTTYGVENTEHYYPIEARRLDELDWVDHLAGKRDGAYQGIGPALAFARQHHAKAIAKHKRE